MMNKKLMLIIIAVFFTAGLWAKGTDIHGIPFGGKAEAVYNKVNGDGWTRTINKRSYEIYQQSQYNGFINPILALYYSGKGTGTYAYSILTLDLFDEESLEKFDVYKESILSTNSLKSTQKKDFVDGTGKLKSQIESSGVMIVNSYSVTLYQDKTKPKLGKDPMAIIILDLDIYDKIRNRSYIEKQIYCLGPKAQELVYNQLFEEPKKEIRKR